MIRYIGDTHQLTERIKTLSDGIYQMELRPLKTDGQNKLLWKLIRKIAKATAQTLDEVYAEVLERTDAASDFIIADPRAEKSLREQFRGVKVIRPYDDNHNIYQVFYGSSTMSTTEMAELIDATQQIACELGVDYGNLYNA